MHFQLPFFLFLIESMIMEAICIHPKFWQLGLSYMDEWILVGVYYYDIDIYEYYKKLKF